MLKPSPRYPGDNTRAAWAAHMARIGALVDRKNRAWRTFMRRTHKLAALADPRTGGNEMLVHNWGNDQARAVWAHGWERWRRYGAAFDRRYRAMLDAAREI